MALTKVSGEVITRPLILTGNASVSGIMTVGTGSTTTTIDGSQDFPTIRPTLDLNFAATKTLDRRITFTRDSIGTYTDEFGIVKYAPNNVPRFDHDPETGESLGLLVEESRTNYFDYSESTSWEDYNGGQTSLEDSTLGILSPTGSTPLVIRPTNTSLTSLLSDRYEAYPSSGGTMIFSVFVKTPPGSQYEEVQLYTSAVSGGNFTASLIFNISTLTTRGAVGTAANAGIFDYGNGWYRICMSFTCPASTSGPIQRVAIVDDVVAQGTTQSDGLLIFGYQLELGSFATSYIPTSGSTVTRAADNAKITGTNFTDFYNQSEGSFYSDIKLNPNFPVSGKASIPFTISDSSYNNRITLASSTGSAAFNADVTISGTNYRAVIGNYTSGSNSIKSSIGYKSADTTGSLNGASPVTSSPSGSLPLLTRADIGKDHTNFNHLCGYIRRITYYPKRLTNAQLQSLTRQ
jgi:hypothetical protein